MGKTRRIFSSNGILLIVCLIFVSPFRLPAPPPSNPTISDIPDQRIFTDTVTRPLSFVISDSQTPAEDLTLSASSSNTGLVPTSKIVFGGSGSNRTVTITPTTNLNGNATITVTVRNGNGKTASDSFVLSVGGFTEVPLGQIGLVYGASAWGDYNNDGLLDLLITGAGPGYNPNTKLFRNNGNGSFTEIVTSLLPVWEGAVAWGDYDNDGDLDILLAGENSIGFGTSICRIYRNNGNETFTDIGAGMQGSYAGSVAWVDFDNDGDLDAFAIGSGVAQLFRNESGTFTNVPTTLPGLYEGQAIWGDYDNDGDKDVFIIGDLGGSTNIARIYRNNGGNFTATGVNLGIGYDSTAAWGDYDNDGNLDLGTTGGDRDTGFPQIYRNNGNDSFTSIATGFPSVSSGSSAWADFDNDGNLDFTFTGINSNDTTVTCLFFNRGSNQFNFLNTPQVRGVWYGETTWADFDNDADVDLLVSGYQIGVSSVFRLYRNDGAMPNPRPSAPTNLGSSIGGGTVLLNWTAATDANQPGGLSYNLRMGTSPGAIDISSPLSDASTGFRRVAAMGNAGQSSGWKITNLSPGTYYWSVQAVDNTFAGSPFAVEHSFTVTAPTITTHPQPQTVIVGANVAFTSSANGTGPLDFQWRFNGTNLAGATNVTLNLTNVQSTQQGSYSVVVSNGFGSAISSNAFLTVLVPPSFSQQPQSQTNLAGSTTLISATVIGTQPLSYRWFFGGTPLANGGRISGATNATLSITEAQTNDAGSYFVIVTNAVGSATSSVATLNIVFPPTITDQPVSQTVFRGEAAGFTVSAEGTAPLTFQWRFNSNNIAGATNQSITLTNVQSGRQGFYSVVVSNPFATVISSSAFLTVIVPPSLTQQPQNQTKLVGENFTFSTVANGSSPLNYQWFFNDVPLTDSGRISGANGAILSITSAQTNDSGNYFVLVTNLAGSVTSVVATLDVGMPPAITLSPVSQTNLVGSNVTFSVMAEGTQPLAFQWRRGGTNLLDDNRTTGSTTSTLNISNLLTSHAGSYVVVVTNSFGSATSAPAIFTLLVPPIFNAQPVGRSVPVGMPTTFSASVTGDAPLTFQWQFNGVDILDATNNSFSIAAVTTNDFGVYTLVASNSVGVATSANALLTLGKIVAWGRNDHGQTVVPANLTNVIMLAAGGIGANPGHNLALRTDGSVVAWGNNAYGQTNVPAGLSNVVAIAAGGLHSMALQSDGKVFAWGNNVNGLTNYPGTLSNIVAIAAGGLHSMALRSDGKLFAWGANSYSLTNVSSFPANITTMACGQYHSLAIRRDGTIFGWGNNSYGQTNPPVAISDAAGVAGGISHSLVLRSNGTAVAWGYYTVTNVPVTLTNGVMATAGDYYNAVLRSNGTVAVWGQNNYSLTNVPVAASNLVSIAGGATHLLGLIGDDAPLIVQQPVGGVNFIGREAVLRGRAIGAAPLNYQWQLNSVNIPDATNATLSLVNLAATNAGNYQLVVSNAFGVATSVPAPLTILNNFGLTIITQPPAVQTNYQGSKVTLNFSVAGNGPLRYQWRLNGANISGATNHEYVFDPVLFENAGNYSAVISNQFANITSGTLMQRVQTIRTWGSTAYSDYYYGSPTPIVTNVISVAAGISHFLALRSDGKIQGWGVNQYGEIYPPAVVSNSIVTAIAAGYYSSLALRSDGVPYAWGYNYYGQTNVPASATNVTAIACGINHSIALRADGTAVAWGNNSNGQTNVPVAATNLVAIAAGQYQSLGLRENGTMIAWGSGPYGSTTIPQNATNIIAIAAGMTHNLALRANGTVIAWGDNFKGQTNVPAGLSNVVAISASGAHSVALRADGTIVSWGSYVSGTSGTAIVPGDLANFIQIADGGDRSIGILGTRAPAVTIQPLNRTALNNSNTVFVAKAVGAQPVSYQWLFNGANISGETNDTLVLTNLQFSQSGAYQLSVSNSYGVSASKAAKLAVSLPLGESLDATNRTWTSTGGAQWFGQPTTTHDGVDAARSGSIANSQESVLQTTILTAGTQISFWWKISSEASFDTLQFRVNGVVQATISGEVDWEQRTFFIPSGANLQTLQWRYSKDFSSSVGQDAAWLDQIDFLPNAPVITLQPLGKTVVMGSNVVLRVTATGDAVGFTWKKDSTNAFGSHFVSNNNSTLTLNNVGRAQSGVYSVIVTNAGGSVTSSNAILNVLVPQQLETPSLQPDGTLLIAARDADGNPLSDADLANMQIQTSTNLIHWETLPGGLILTNGNLQFVDPEATNLSNRFYRIMELP